MLSFTCEIILFKCGSIDTDIKVRLSDSKVVVAFNTVHINTRHISFFNHCSVIFNLLLLIVDPIYLYSTLYVLIYSMWLHSDTHTVFILICNLSQLNCLWIVETLYSANPRIWVDCWWIWTYIHEPCTWLILVTFLRDQNDCFE